MTFYISYLEQLLPPIIPANHFLIYTTRILLLFRLYNRKREGRVVGIFRIRIQWELVLQCES